MTPMQKIQCVRALYRTLTFLQTTDFPRTHVEDVVLLHELAVELEREAMEATHAK